MADPSRYFVVCLPMNSKPDRMILVRDSTASLEDTIARAQFALSQASIPSRQLYENASKIEQILADFTDPLSITVHSEHPALAAAGLDAVKEVLSRRTVRVALSLELALLLHATSLAEQNEETSLFSDNTRFRAFLRVLLQLNHPFAAYLLARELNQPFELPRESLAPSIAGESVLMRELAAQEDFLSVMSNAPYHALREALAMNRFQHTADSPWPTAAFETGSTRGQAQLFPVEAELQPFLDPDSQKSLIDRMWEQRAELSDLDADVLDMMSAIWLEQARNTDSTARARIDDLLRLRGLKPKTGEGGRNSGFRREQRERLFRSLHHLNNIWVRMWEFDALPSDSDSRSRRSKIQNISSRAFIITDIAGNQRGSDSPLEVEEFLFRPGMVFANFLFGVGRQTALLSRKAVQYDPYRQNWEKRLARYLSWQWRIEASVPSTRRTFRAKTLLDAVGETWSAQQNKSLRDRLEKALNRLATDNIIARWDWIHPTNPHAVRRFLRDFWHHGSVEIQQPDLIRQHYAGIASATDHSARQLPLEPQSQEPHTLHQRLLACRKRASLTQGQVASILGITQAYYSQVESGKRDASKVLLDRIQNWIESIS